VFASSTSRASAARWIPHRLCSRTTQRYKLGACARPSPAIWLSLLIGFGPPHEGSRDGNPREFWCDRARHAG
jgi:hypothetical protein